MLENSKIFQKRPLTSAIVGSVGRVNLPKTKILLVQDHFRKIAKEPVGTKTLLMNASPDPYL